MYPGFSGGALVDENGRCIGLATSHYGRGGGIGIPLQTVLRVGEALRSHGRVRRGFLGIASQRVLLPEATREKLGLEQPSGLLLVGIDPGGPAERAGLLIGDILIALGTTPVRGTDDLRDALGPESVGQSTAVRVIRGGERRDLTATIGERE
jgi:S1-C subfamily serine protease